MSDDVLISVENVSKKFARRLRHAMWYGLCDLGREVAGLESHGEQLRNNEFWALQDISFELKRGECLGIIGPNGSGKSTLLKLLNGIIRPTQGRIRVRGRVGALIEVGAGFHPMLTGRENIYVNGAILGMGKTEIDRKFDQIVEFADIGDFLDTPVKFYSSGMYVRLGFAIAAHLEPDILLIDEVLAVGDAGFRFRSFCHIRETQQRCATIFVSHDMDAVTRICTHGLFLQNGRSLNGVESPLTAAQRYLGATNTETELMEKGIRVLGVRLDADSHDGEYRVRYGEPIAFEADLEANLAGRTVTAWLTFLDLRHTGVAECHSGHCGYTLNWQEQATRMRVRIPKLTLSPGKYLISFTVSDGQGEQALAWFRAGVKLQVLGDFVSGVKSQIQGQWHAEASHISGQDCCDKPNGPA